MSEQATTPRPPIISVVGHIDHGKSSLLDSIREAHAARDEAGGITQHVSAYEVSYMDSENVERRMTFLDTPGHEAFSGSRERGVQLADIAILVIAADDGIQAQTIESLSAIREAGLPFIVAINKVDKSGANADKIKQDLLQHEVYVEQYSGSTPAVEVSATEGQGINDLMEIIALASDMEELTYDPTASASGRVLESERDAKRGISATLLLMNGTLSKGEVVATTQAVAPVRIMENFRGETIDEATPASPVNIVGWSTLPQVGDEWHQFTSKKEAESYTEDAEHRSDATYLGDPEAAHAVVPVILKADTNAGIDGLQSELAKQVSDRVALKIIRTDIGTITENDALSAVSSDNAVIAGFNVSIDAAARTIAEREGLDVATFSVIYDATHWITDIIARRRPTITEETTTGSATVLRKFSETKQKQVIGGRVEEGEITVNKPVIIRRRGTEVGRGQISNLQHQKADVSKVEEGQEFGAEIEAKLDIQPKDTLEVFDVVET